MSSKLSLLLLLVVCSVFLQTCVQLTDARRGWFSSHDELDDGPIVPKVGLARLASLTFKEVLEEPIPEPIIPTNATQEEIDRFKAWKASPLYVPTFDPNVITLPEEQLEQAHRTAYLSNQLYKDILHDAVVNHGKWMPSVGLMARWSIKLMKFFIHARRQDQAIQPRCDPKPEFFNFLADLIEYTVKESARIIEEKGYNKETVDIEAFNELTKEGWDYLRDVFMASPVGSYLRFDKIVAFADNKSHPKHGIPLPVFVCEQLAQFRAIGYESTMFVANQLVNMLRLFAKNKIPTL